MILLSPYALNVVLHGFSLGQLERLFRVDCAIKFASAPVSGYVVLGCSLGAGRLGEKLIKIVCSGV